MKNVTIKLLDRKNDYFFKEEALNKGTFRAPLRSGFTLIELLVVVLIIGILAAVALPQYTKAVEKSRAIEAWTTLKAIEDAQQAYRMENGKRAIDFADLVLSFVDKNGNVVSGDGFYTKTYFYSLVNGMCPSTGETAALAYPLTAAGVPAGDSYFLVYCEGKRYCAADLSDMCSRLGLKKDTSLNCASGSTCWTD